MGVAVAAPTALRGDCWHVPQVPPYKIALCELLAAWIFTQELHSSSEMMIVHLETAPVPCKASDFIKGFYGRFWSEE